MSHVRHETICHPSNESNFARFLSQNIQDSSQSSWLNSNSADSDLSREICRWNLISAQFACVTKFAPLFLPNLQPANAISSEIVSGFVEKVIWRGLRLFHGETGNCQMIVKAISPENSHLDVFFLSSHPRQAGNCQMRCEFRSQFRIWQSAVKMRKSQHEKRLQRLLSGCQAKVESSRGCEIVLNSPLRRQTSDIQSSIPEATTKTSRKIKQIKKWFTEHCVSFLNFFYSRSKVVCFYVSVYNF